MIRSGRVCGRVTTHLFILLFFSFFSVSPRRDASEDDLKLWLPQPEKASQDLDVEMSVFLLTHVGDQFCLMIQTEREAKAAAMAPPASKDDGHDDPASSSSSAAAAASVASAFQQIAWKRVVQGVREMCDVCETTLFNFHWACGKCGYVVCIDCYKSRRDAQLLERQGHVTNGTGAGARDHDDREVPFFLFFFFPFYTETDLSALLWNNRKEH